MKIESTKSNKIHPFFTINENNPEKFFILFKKYLDIIKTKNDTYILFMCWNNYIDNSYLEPNEKFGYSYLNYFSKAVFNFDDNVMLNEIESLNYKSKIAVQVHLYYYDLLGEIINKINNIPAKFDLFISIISPKIYNNLKEYICRHSKANYYEILIVENKGRDILPFINQMKNKFKFYKYLCHIHTKKSKTAISLGFRWRNYLFENLLGKKYLVSKILNDLEKNEKLGLIFPEAFYLIINQFYLLTEGTKKWMEFLISKLFPNYKMGELLDFPAGNMFWAKTAAIFQIFIYDLNEYFPKENHKTDGTIMHAIERIWLYIAKYNEFNYKTVLYFF